MAKRDFRWTILGLVAVAAPAALPGADARSKAPRVTLPDVAGGRDGGSLLPNGWRVTPAGRPIPLPGDLPLKMALTPDGRYLLVNTGGYHDHGVSVIDVASEKLTQTVNVAKDWAGLCFNSDGARVYVAGSGTPSRDFLDGASKSGLSADGVEALKKPILTLSFSGGKLSPAPSIDIADLTGDKRWIAGLASGPDGAIYAVNTNTDTVYKLDGQTHAVAATAKIGYRPYSAALSADGKTLAVSNWGDQSVSLLDPATLAEEARVPVGSHPNEVVWNKDGRLFVANAGSNSVSVLKDGKVVEVVKTSIDPKAPVGSTPDALAVSPDGKRLFVANADNNDVAVVDVSEPDESRVIGFIPTGWYPSALAVSPDGRRLFVGTGKGLSFGPSATAETRVEPEVVRHYNYIGSCLSGAVSVVDLPDENKLRAYTRQVQGNVPVPRLRGVDTAGVQRNAFSKIKHVVYIIRENRTYDQVFGDIKTGNGDPAICLFGQHVTPNAHTLAGDFVLLDNLYCNGEVSEDGHQWCNGAYATDFTERAWVGSYSGRDEPDGDDRLSASPAGYLWDNCAKHGVTYRAYGEASAFKSSPNSAPVFTGPKVLDGHASFAYSQLPWFGKEHPDPKKADVFISDLKEAEKKGDWPQFMVMSLPEDHTVGLSAGEFTPSACVAANDQALGRIVEAVSHSKFWPETAIFVIEDDAQNGADHVDAHRTVGLVISPYVKRGAVDSTLYTTSSFIHTMELILGLPPMTQFDAAAMPLYTSFTSSPNLVAYSTVSPQTDLEAKNPKTGSGAEASAKLDFSDVDRADPDALNAILWQALRPGRPMPAPVRSARLITDINGLSR